MGPQLDSCGREKRLDDELDHSDASMGPQLDSCGRFVTQKQRAGYCALQWGRNLIVAEGRGPAGGAQGTRLLQWGRNLIVAEGSINTHNPSWIGCFNGAAT